MYIYIYRYVYMYLLSVRRRANHITLLILSLKTSVGNQRKSFGTKRKSSGNRIGSPPKTTYLAKDVISSSVCMHVRMYVCVCMSICMYVSIVVVVVYCCC